MLPARLRRAPVLRVLSAASLLVCILSAGACSKPGTLRPLVSAPIERRASEGTAPIHTELLTVRVTLHEDGTFERSERHRYRILDESGVENWGHTSAYYSPWYMDPPRIEARVTNGSTVTPLDLKVLSQEPAHPSAPDVYGDSRVIRGPLPTVRVGSIIEETIVTRTHKPFLAPNSLHYVTFASSIPSDKIELIVDAPVSKKVSFEVRDAVVKRSERTEGGRRIYTFVGGPTEALEYPEALISSELPYWPSVAFSTGVGWDELAAIYAKIVEERLTGVDFPTIVKQVVVASDSERTKLAKLHAWVKERVRYIGIEFGESSVVPFPPDQVVARGFGDCKDQAVLLVGLLRAAGFKANVALLRSGTGEDVIPSLPSLDVFNHAIVHVGGKEALWIDPTAEYLRLGTLPTGDEGRLALIAASSTKDLTRISSSTSTENTYSEERNVVLSEHGNANLVEVTRATGLLDWELRTAFAKSEEEIRDSMKSYVERVYEAEELGSVEHSDATAVLEPFSLSVEAKKSTIGSTTPLEAWADLAEATVLTWVPDALREGDEERRSDMHLILPYSAELVWNVRPPQGFAVLEKPEPVTRQFGPSRLTRSVGTNPDGSLTMRTRFDSGKRQLSAKEVNDFREDYEVWGQSRVPRVTFEHRSQKLIRDGDAKGGVRLLEDEAKQTPQAAIPRLRLARTLETFLFDEALAEGRKAASLEPKNSDVQLEVGHILSNNLVGVDMGEGFDRTGALAAYRRAVKADEKDTHAKLRLANVLETSALGYRYFAPQADLEEALEVYASIPAKELREYDDGGFRNNALFLSFWADKNDRLRTELLGMPIEEVPTEVALMNEAARVKTVEAVLSEAERLHLKDEARSVALEQAARVFTSARQYREAERVLSEAMASSTNPDRLQSRLTMTRRTKKVSMQALPTTTPEEVAVKVLVHAIGARKIDMAFLEPYLAKAARLKKEKSYLIERLETVNISKSTGMLEEEVLLDMMYGAMDATREGSDKLGYRVKITQETAQDGVKHTFYVIKEDGRYKVRAYEARNSELGAEALAAASRGNDAMAKQWLDWGRETFGAYEEKEPLRVLPFVQAWAGPDGKKKGNVNVELAAAMLAVESDSADRALATLKSAAATEKDRDNRILLLHAQHQAEIELEDYSSALKTADLLVSLLPDSVPAFWRRIDTLWELQRYADFEKGIRSRLAKGIESERIGLTRSLASALIAQKKIAEGMKVRQGLIDKREASGGDYNDQAWDGIFVGITAVHLEHALRSVEVEKGSSNLHTLAAVYAELGKLSDAARTMRELFKRRKDTKPLDIDYYILGRLAEGLGYRDEAKAYYQKVEKPKKEWPTSTYEIAKRRLAKL